MPSMYRDPWAAREAWRKHPVFSNKFMFRNFVPGFALGAAAFGTYVAVDMLFHPSNIEKLKEDARKQRGEIPATSLLSSEGGVASQAASSRLV